MEMVLFHGHLHLFPAGEVATSQRLPLHHLCVIEGGPLPRSHVYMAQVPFNYLINLPKDSNIIKLFHQILHVVFSFSHNLKTTEIAYMLLFLFLSTTAADECSSRRHQAVDGSSLAHLSFSSLSDVKFRENQVFSSLSR